MGKTIYGLMSCLWELTLKCNLHCIHCGSEAGLARKEELSLDECYRVADDIIKLGCKELTFIGGEIFLYKGWERIANYLSNHEIVVNIMSNGYRIDEEEINQIKYAKLSNVGISLDGTETIHNKIRCNNNSFTNIQKSFDALNKANIPIGVVTSLLETNYFDLEDLYQFLVKNNVNLWQLQLVNPMGNMVRKRELILNTKYIPALINFIREKNKERKMLVVAGDNIGYYDKNEPYIRGTRSPICLWTGCQAGISSLFIDSVGNVKGCGALYNNRFIEGNVRQTCLTEIWNDDNNFIYNRRFKKDLLSGDCKGCSLGTICKGGCRASNYFMTDSLYTNAFCSRLN